MFGISESYPAAPPIINIRSSVLNSEQTASLISSLQTEAASKVGQSMLAELMTSCKNWLNENDIDVSVTAVAEKSKNKKRSKKSIEGKMSEKIKSENETLEKSVCTCNLK